MSKYEQKIDKFIFEDIKKWKNIKILEFGVRFGVSTKKFINLIENNDGHLYSIDIDDCSKILSSEKWTFIQSRDDNFEYIEKKIPENFDVIFLDSFHNANHVEKIFYRYYQKLKINGLFFIDDISWIPYVKDGNRNSFNSEINNLETFNRTLEILRSNTDNIEVYFSFQNSGLVKIIKKSQNKLNPPKKILSRSGNLKNFLRKILLR